MSRVKNRGVSMVEILISIAIFAILMIPIVSGIISAMHNTTQSKTLQYRNEYAENLMEYAKEESLVNILEGGYLSSIGSYDNTVSFNFYKSADASTYDSSLKPIADLAEKILGTGNGPTVADSDVTNEKLGTDAKDFPYEVYTLAGKVKLGTDHKTYSYKMQISNKYYAEKEAAADKDGTTYVNPNNLALGIVEDIDHTKVALINGTIANYDAAVSNAFMTRKIDILREYDSDWYDIYVNQQTDAVLFPDDKATRVITVKVSGSEKDGYQVICKLSYQDSGKSNSTVEAHIKDYTIEYVPFEYNYPVDPETNKAVLPNIYLMYNVCLYNGNYSDHDYIVFDTEDMKDDTEIKCFIVQTAASYSDSLRDANGIVVNKKTDGQGNVIIDDNGNEVEIPLYNDDTSSGGTRDDVIIHLLATKNSADTLKNLSVYHNFDIGITDDPDDPNPRKNKKNSMIYYISGVDGLYGDLSESEYMPLESYISGGRDDAHSIAYIGSLDSAKEENRGLYEISLWMVEGDDINAVDTSKNPIMTGTKGGDES